MKVGGTGDTLAGIVAALMEHAEPLDAAAVGAHVNGLAGERLAEDGGYGYLATDLLEEIPAVLWVRPMSEEPSSAEGRTRTREPTPPRAHAYDRRG